jgi:acyl-homoserine lactone synthase
MQAIVVDHTNSSLYADELDQFHFQRHRVYAEELEWVPAVPSRREFDPFDTNDAVFILFMEDGKLVAGSRLIETDKPHLVSEVFPNIFTIAPIVRSASVVEWTRGFVIPERRGDLRLMAQCCAAVMEYCIEHGYSQIGGIQDTKWLALWRKMRWNVRIHGEAVMMGEDPWLPAYFDVSYEAMANARLLGRLPGSVLLDSRRPAVPQVA